MKLIAVVGTLEQWDKFLKKTIHELGSKGFGNTTTTLRIASNNTQYIHTEEVNHNYDDVIYLNKGEDNV